MYANYRLTIGVESMNYRPTLSRYEVLKVADAMVQTEGDLAVVVLDTNQGRIDR